MGGVLKAVPVWVETASGCGWGGLRSCFEWCGNEVVGNGSGAGRPWRRPLAERVLLVAVYYRRRLLRARGITPKIARKGTSHGSGLGKTCWVAERTFAWLHQLKRLRIRYEMRADLHLALLQLACSTIYLRRLHSSF